MRLADENDRDAVMELQRAAYARNRELLGLEPLPLLAPVAEIFEDYEVWLLEYDDQLLGVLILEPRADDMLIWSIATAPQAQGRGLGALMLKTAELRARQFGHKAMALYTSSALEDLIGWYKRQGYAVSRIEQISDRELTHMSKSLDQNQEPQ